MSAAPLHADNAAQAEYWNCVAGQKWTDHQQHQDQVLSPVSDRLIAAARPKQGDRVIDVGCGCGATTIEFAARVSPGGEVLGLDISEPMLGRARERAEGLPIRFERADATVHAFKPEAADLVASRFGVMFFADPARSFANLRSGLKVGGRLAFACWREARQNPFFILPLREAGKHAPPLPETDPEAPGPFAFASEARVRRILSEAGFADVALEPHDLELDIAVGRGTRRSRQGRDDDRADQPDARRAERGRPLRRGGGHPQGALRPRARRQRAARRRDLDRHGDQSWLTPRLTLRRFLPLPLEWPRGRVLKRRPAP